MFNLLHVKKVLIFNYLHFKIYMITKILILSLGYLYFYYFFLNTN